MDLIFLGVPTLFDIHPPFNWDSNDSLPVSIIGSVDDEENADCHYRQKSNPIGKHFRVDNCDEPLESQIGNHLLVDVLDEANNV